MVEKVLNFDCQQVEVIEDIWDDSEGTGIKRLDLFNQKVRLMPCIQALIKFGAQPGDTLKIV